MSVPLKPLADRIVLQVEEAKSQTASGLFIPDTAKEKSKIAKVAAIGGDVKTLKIGDKVVYKEYSTTEIKIEGVEYLILKEEDVLATIS